MTWRWNAPALAPAARRLGRLRAPCPPADLYADLLDPGLAARVLAEQQPDFLAELPKISTHEHYRVGGRDSRRTARSRASSASTR